MEAGCQSLTKGKRISTPYMAGLGYQAMERNLFGGHGEAHDYRAVRHGRVVSDHEIAPSTTNTEIDRLLLVASQS